MLFKGTINESLVHPREVFKEAYLLSASSIICVHNHPSGNVTPSKNDEVLTKQLKNCGELLGIRVLDHIIVGNNSYFSFLEKGLL
jgi:DNA repair protein RadC